jgi:putative IMPACT (imprinted ancient) family translation regulator
MADEAKIEKKTLEDIQTQFATDLKAIVDDGESKTTALRAQVRDLMQQIRDLEGPEVMEARQTLNARQQMRQRRQG